MIYEFCAENMTDLQRAYDAGAHRIELCDNLAVGGTTPCYGVLKEGCSWARKHDVRVMTMLRPRGGNFVYNKVEVEAMMADMAIAMERGSNGIVMGCLTEDGWLDEWALTRLRKQSDMYREDFAEECELVFHMAFDEIPVERQFEAMEWLIANRFDRILTRAGGQNSSIEERLLRYKELIAYADGRITILPGGGITVENRQRFADELGVEELHGTRIVF